MQPSESIEVTLDYVARVLIRSFLLGYIFVIIWFLLFLFGFDGLYRMQSHWFEISRTGFHIVNYCGIGLAKLILIVFFLLPYLSIRWVLRKKG